MPFELTVEKDTKIKVVVSKDSAITKREAYPEYLDSFSQPSGPHEELLGLSAEPTRFVLQRTLPYVKKQQIRSKAIKVKTGQDGADVEIDVNYQTEMVRAALVDIENPGTVPEHKRLKMKREKDGLASNEIMGVLDAAGVLDDIVTAYSNATAKNEKDAAESKNS